ncbi:MAG: holin [Pseudomonas sp.]|nr:holin [Pseudomonas sp.]
MAAQHTHTELAAEVVGASLGQKATMAGAATGLVGWLAQVNWIGIAGVVIAALGLAANIYFQIRRDRREVAESTARIEALKERCEP